MSNSDTANPGGPRSWAETFRAFLQPSVVTMLFLGFSAGIPILLIFSSLGLWLREAGVERATVTMFSWAALGYSFKFVWAPLVDKLPLPLLTRWLGRRRSWLLASQLAVIAAILWMAFTDPAAAPFNLTLMAAAAVLLGFSSATQDIVIDAYRIESAPADIQALMSSTYIAGYRLAMLLAGAGTLVVADSLGTDMGNYIYSAWRWAYVMMAVAMLVGVFTTLRMPEPEATGRSSGQYGSSNYLRFILLFALAVCAFISAYVLSSAEVAALKNGSGAMGAFFVEGGRLLLGVACAAVAAVLLLKLGVANINMVRESYLEPIRDFFQRYGMGLACLLLALVGLYRISDIVLGVISNVFYQDMGFSKNQIAGVVKTFGVVMTLLGGFLGGLLAVRYGVMRILFVGALLSALTNLLFMLLASAGNDIVLLYVVISADNLAGGLASAAFVAFLSSLTNISFTAMQYAIFSSLMTLLPKVIGGYSGAMVDSIGYPQFFLGTALMGIPVLLLILLASRHLKVK